MDLGFVQQLMSTESENMSCKTRAAVLLLTGACVGTARVLGLSALHCDACAILRCSVAVAASWILHIFLSGVVGVAVQMDRNFRRSSWSETALNYVNNTKYQQYFVAQLVAAATACCESNSSGRNLSTAALVASMTTGGATPASAASFHRMAHRHHLLPGFKPGKLDPLGVVRSLPLAAVKFKNSVVMIAQTTCEPWSDASVRQKPSRK